MARYWYELKMLFLDAIGKSAIENRALLVDVVRVNELIFNVPYDNYPECLNRQFHLTPGDELLDAICKDYEAMLKTGMIYGAVPTIAQVMNGIQEIECLLND